MLVKLKFITSVSSGIFDKDTELEIIYKYFFKQGYTNKDCKYTIHKDYTECEECNNINFDGFSLWQIE